MKIRGVGMSEEMKKYLADNESKTELQFYAKRLVDFTKEFEKLNEEEKRYVIERVDNIFGYGLVELYNALGEYME